MKSKFWYATYIILIDIKQKYNEPYEGQEKFKFKIFDCVRYNGDPDSIYVVCSYLIENYKPGVKSHTFDRTKRCVILEIKTEYDYAMVGSYKKARQEDLTLISDEKTLKIVNQLEDYFKYLRYVKHK